MANYLHVFAFPSIKSSSLNTLHPLSPQIRLETYTAWQDYVPALQTIKGITFDNMPPKISISGPIVSFSEFEILTRLVYDILPESYKQIILDTQTTANLSIEELEYIAHSYDQFSFPFEGTAVSQDILHPGTHELLLDKLEMLSTYKTSGFSVLKSLTFHNVDNFAADVLMLRDNDIPFVPYIDLTLSHILRTEEPKEVQYANFLVTMKIQLLKLRSYGIDLVPSILKFFLEDPENYRTKSICDPNGLHTFTYPSRLFLTYDNANQLHFNASAALDRVISSYEAYREQAMRDMKVDTRTFGMTNFLEASKTDLYIATATILRGIR